MKTYNERTAVVMEQVAKKKKTRRMWVAICSSSAACLVVLVLSLVLFLPFKTDEPSRPTDSPYQKVIDALHLSATDSTAPRNNFELLINRSIGVIPKASAPVAISDNVMYDGISETVENAPANSENYQENTNNQVEGVREGDLLKQSTNYFYYLRLEPVDTKTEDDSMFYWYRYYYTKMRMTLSIYQKMGQDSALVAEYTFAPTDGFVYNYSLQEMYLNDACDTLTVVSDAYDEADSGDYRQSFTSVITLDISVFDNIVVKKEQRVSGICLSSRMVNNRLLLVTSYSPQRYDLYKPETFVPYVKSDDDVALVAPDAIWCPEEVDAYSYTVVTLFDEQAARKDQLAFLQYGNIVYASLERLYVVGYPNYIYNDEAPDTTMSCDTTNVMCIEYGDSGLTQLGEIVVPGIILNQYSLDEYQGVLRVAATIRTYVKRNSGYGDWWDGDKINSGLYCYDVESRKLIAKEEYFAPQDETVRSARFMGTKAYICTAVQSRDPVFCFDLSDYSHITYTHTGTITGFSMSLSAFADDTLLGVGVDENYFAKIELYRDGTDTVDAFTRANVPNSDLCSEYKTYLIDAQNGLVGVPVYLWLDDIDADNTGKKSGYYYAVFRYVDDQIVLDKMVAIQVYNGQMERIRAAQSDGFVYLFDAKSMQVLAIDR